MILNTIKIYVLLMYSKKIIIYNVYNNNITINQFILDNLTYYLINISF
uniref:Uncharacterized protein n=1 Tax=viral metagenome TaxID=1070528 RepID=A0A6C0E1C0_9ZZZZ